MLDQVGDRSSGTTRRRARERSKSRAPPPITGVGPPFGGGPSLVDAGDGRPPREDARVRRRRARRQGMPPPAIESGRPASRRCRNGRTRAPSSRSRSSRGRGGAATPSGRPTNVRRFAPDLESPTIDPKIVVGRRRAAAPAAAAAGTSAMNSTSYAVAPDGEEARPPPTPPRFGEVRTTDRLRLRLQCERVFSIQSLRLRDPCSSWKAAKRPSFRATLRERILFLKRFHSWVGLQNQGDLMKLRVA